jgi:hypothetical protein
LRFYRKGRVTATITPLVLTASSSRQYHSPELTPSAQALLVEKHSAEELKVKLFACIGKMLCHGSNLSSLSNILERPDRPLSSLSVIVGQDEF